MARTSRAEAAAAAPPPVFDPADPVPNPETLLNSPAAVAPDPKSFFESLKALTAEEWEKHIVYVYRLEPITDRIAAGNSHKFIAKFVGPFDEDQIMRDHGSGKYRALLNRITPAGRETTVGRHEFSIENGKFPPKIPAGEWVEDPRNRKWANWSGAKDAAKPEAAASGNAAELIAAVRSIYADMRPADTQADVVRAVLDAVKQTRAELGRSSDSSQLIELLKACGPMLAPVLANLFAPKATHDEVLMKILLQQQADLQKLIEAKSSPTASLKDTIQTITLLRDAFPAAAPADSSMLSNLLQYAPALLSMFARRPPAGAPAPAIAPPIVQQPPAAMPPSDATQQENPMPQFTPEQLEHIQRLVMTNAHTLFRFLQSGRSGVDYADYFVEGNSFADFEALKNFGLENLMNSLRAVPVAWQMIAPIEPQFRQFMTDFYSWTPEDPDEDGGDDDDTGITAVPEAA